MSDDDAYSSDESSNDEESQSVVATNKTNANKKPQELTLADNDDDFDDSAFKRPDLNDIEAEGDYEDDGEYGECSDTENTTTTSKPPISKQTSKNDSSKPKRTITQNTSNADSRAESEDPNKKAAAAAAALKKKKKRQLFICLTATKYDCVRRVAKKLNFKEVGEEEDWTLYWTDTSVSVDRVNQMKRWQKINHFPGMSEICRKDFLTRNMNRMAKLFPKDYSFYPKAWCLPADYADLMNYARLKKNKTYICKPDSGCQGRGIFLTKNPFKDIKPGDNYVAQVYVSRPFVIDGFKFDLRVYVAVTSCDPFRIFVYKEGLGRFTTQQYEEPSQNNCKDVFMHLTNYAIQKRSEDFIRDEDTGTKRRISTINKWLTDKGFDVDKMWNDIDDVVIKVLISAYPVLKHSYRTCFPNHYKGSACFEILGFDILLDKKLKPSVLEVNHSPSFTTDSKLDREIKDALIYDTIMLLNIGTMDKRRCIEEERKRVRERLFLRGGKKETKEELEETQQQWLQIIDKWENKHMGNYRRIYPIPGVTEKYDKYFNNSGTLFSETAASKARQEQAKQQIEEIQRKNEKILGNKQNTRLNINNKELRGESPSRKQTFSNQTTSSKPTRLQSRSSIVQNGNMGLLNANTNSIINTNSNYSTVSTASTQNLNTFNNNQLLTGYNNNKFRNSFQLPTLLLTNATFPDDDYLSYSNYTNRSFRLKSNPIDMNMNMLKTIAPIDTLKPMMIDEAEELDRIQALKQRESLVKGMGITEFVHRILFGTPGTVAAVPPPIHNANNNNNNNSAINNQNLNITTNNNNNTNNNHSIYQYQQEQQSQDILHTNNKYVSSPSNFKTNLNNNNNNSSKLELKTRNYNPFDSHLINEKLLSSQQSRNNLKAKVIPTTNNNFSINTISLNTIQKKSDSNGSSIVNGGVGGGNNLNNRYQQYSATNHTSHPNQFQNQTNFGINLITTVNNNNDNQNIMLNNSEPQYHPTTSHHDSHHKKLSAKLTDIQLQKNDNTSLFNYRVRSAQNLAKQRATGFYIFSYNIPRVNSAAAKYQQYNEQN